MKQRNNSIDAVKGLAIVMVMLGHVFVHNHMEDAYVYDFIKAVQMPLFMIISGYLCGQGKKIKNLRMYGTVMGKRAISYLVPVFTWLTIMHLEHLSTAYRTIFFQLDYGLWFLAVLYILTFYIYTAQLVASVCKAEKPVLSEVIFWTVYGLFCVILVAQILVGNTFLSPYLVIIYVPFYMVGYLFGNYGKKFLCWDIEETGKLDCKNNRFIQVGILLIAVTFLYLVAARNLNSMETKLDILLQMHASLLGSTAIVYGSLWWKDGKIKNIFAKIGRHTLEIYVIHYHFANMLNFNDKQYNFYTFEGFIFVIISFLSMCAVTFCSIWLMKKVKILDFLFFGKKTSTD